MSQPGRTWRMLLLLAACLTGFWGAASAADIGVQRLARAPVDEAFYGLGDPRNRWFASPADPALRQALEAGAKPKRNGGYVWAMTASGSDLWFGTNHNGWCGWLMVSGLFEPGANSSWVCETHRSAFRHQKDSQGQALYPPQAPPVQADWRPPGIYRLDTRSQQLTQLQSEDPRFHELMRRSYGFRAAATHAGLVFMAATPIGLTRAEVYLFAIEAATGRLVDVAVLPGYLNVREMRVLAHADGSAALYMLAGPEIFPGPSANHLLRWRGTAAAPFSGGSAPTPGWEVVGDLQGVGIGVSLLAFDERILLSTWPSAAQPAGLYEAHMPAAGFSAALPARFSKLLDATQLEADPVVARTWLLSPLAQHEGWFYWGTMHPTGMSHQALSAVYPALKRDEESIRKSHRRASLYRSRFDGQGPLVTELLYGEARQWAYVRPQGSMTGGSAGPASGGSSGGAAGGSTGLPAGSPAGTWQLQAPALALAPRHGASGFGETFLDYVWTFATWQGSLVVGTFDVSGGVQTLMRENADAVKSSVLSIIGSAAAPESLHPGFDLYRLDPSTGRASALTRDGFGNPASTGVRNMIVLDQDLYLGTSSHSNLDDRQGGWEILRLLKRGPQASPSSSPRAAPPRQP